MSDMHLITQKYATATVLAKVLSANYSCNIRVSGLGEIFLPITICNHDACWCKSAGVANKKEHLPTVSSVKRSHFSFVLSSLMAFGIHDDG